MRTLWDDVYSNIFNKMETYQTLTHRDISKTCDSVVTVVLQLILDTGVTSSHCSLKVNSSVHKLFTGFIFLT